MLNDRGRRTRVLRRHQLLLPRFNLKLVDPRPRSEYGLELGRASLAHRQLELVNNAVKFKGDGQKL